MTLKTEYVCKIQAALLVFLSAMLCVLQTQASGQTRVALTPLQLEIEKQRQRLDSIDVEERRDAVMRLGAMRRPEASRVAVRALSDTSAIIRATAAAAVLGLPVEEAAAALIPGLKDKEEFIRQETAYALGKTHSRSAVAPLSSLFESEKKDGVRGAAVIALGEIADETAVAPLVQVLTVKAAGRASKKRASKDNPFILRAAVRSLGQIGSRAAVPALVAVVEDETLAEDVRRQAAHALGVIGDPSVTATLRAMLGTPDPYLSEAAYAALRKIEFQNRQR